MKIYLLWAKYHRYGGREVLHGLYEDNDDAVEDMKIYQADVPMEQVEYYVQPVIVSLKREIPVSR